jgi:Macrocin-O-methyltransferase (TylF)
MKAQLLRSFKRALTQVGAQAPDPWLHQLQMVVNYMKLGRWMSQRGFSVPERVRDRNSVFAAVADRVADRRVLYTEFGVFRGASTRYWSAALRNPGSHLHGFDSFQGLPEDFDVAGPYVKGTFDVAGKPPVIDDPRVQFFVGWFDDTVPKYTPPAHDTLVMCMDADLYSSTKVVLDHFKPWIKAGTFIYFDDMSRPDHEPRAFDEFMQQTGLRFNVVSTEESLNCTFFECIG